MSRAKGWADRRTSMNFAPGPQPTVTGQTNDVERRPTGFVVWSKRDTGEIVAVAELGDVIVPGDAEPLLWDGDQA